MLRDFKVIAIIGALALGLSAAGCSPAAESTTVEESPNTTHPTVTATQPSTNTSPPTPETSVEAKAPPAETPDVQSGAGTHGRSLEVGEPWGYHPSSIGPYELLTPTLVDELGIDCITDATTVFDLEPAAWNGAAASVPYVKRDEVDLSQLSGLGCDLVGFVSEDALAGVITIAVVDVGIGPPRPRECTDLGTTVTCSQSEPNLLGIHARGEAGSDAQASMEYISAFLDAYIENNPILQDMMVQTGPIKPQYPSAPGIVQ